MLYTHYAVQVGIGESTCGAKWFAGPKDEDCKECNALFDISELSRVALERASTARCVSYVGERGEGKGRESFCISVSPTLLYCFIQALISLTFGCPPLAVGKLSSLWETLESNMVSTAASGTLWTS